MTESVDVEKMTEIDIQGSINGAFDYASQEPQNGVDKSKETLIKAEGLEDENLDTKSDLSSELKRYIEWELNNAVSDLKYELKRVVQEETRKTIKAVLDSSKDLKSVVETSIESCTSSQNEETAVTTEVEKEDDSGSSDNKPDDVIQSKFEVVFEQQDKIVPSRGNLLATIPTLGREFHVHFSFTIGGSSTGSRNIFHMSADANSGVYGHCIPAVHFLSAKKCFSIISAVNGDQSYKQTTTSSLPSENTYNIDIIQEHNEGRYYCYKIYLNDILMHAVLNNDARVFHSVHVYVSNPWTTEQPGVMDNLVIKTKQ